MLPFTPECYALRLKYNSWGTYCKISTEVQISSMFCFCACGNVFSASWESGDKPYGRARTRGSSPDKGFICACALLRQGQSALIPSCTSATKNQQLCWFYCLVTNCFSPCPLLTSICFTDAHRLFLFLSSCNLFPLVKSISIPLGYQCPLPFKCLTDEHI